MALRTWNVLILLLPPLLLACSPEIAEITTQETVEKAAPEEAEPAWKVPLEKITVKKDAMIADLDAAHAKLTERAKVEDPALLAILEPEPPKPRQYGYGILPELKESPPFSEIKPLQTFYYIKWLEEQFDPEYEKAKQLEVKIENEPHAPLKPLVDEYDRLKKRLALLENHLSYHRQWQKAIVDFPDFFDRKNNIVAQIRTVRKYNGNFDALRKDILPEVARFLPAKSLKITNDPSGTKTLTVPIHTDITDDGFLQDFEQAVDTEFNQSQAAQDKHFRLKLTLIKVDPKTLYPNGAPATGEHIDMEKHVARFPQGSLILTTGAKSTHAMQARYVALGSAPMTKRTLAHEFGHILGFNDAYLRGYDGKPDAPYGATIVEWTGLYSDLMGNPGGGEVSPLMIETLIQTYSK